jgi:hypothetical protein
MNKDEDVRVLDVAELVAAALPQATKTAHEKDVS